MKVYENLQELLDAQKQEAKDRSTQTPKLQEDQSVREFISLLYRKDLSKKADELSAIMDSLDLTDDRLKEMQKRIADLQKEVADLRGGTTLMDEFKKEVNAGLNHLRSAYENMNYYVFVAKEAMTAAANEIIMEYTNESKWFLHNACARLYDDLASCFDGLLRLDQAIVSGSEKIIQKAELLNEASGKEQGSRMNLLRSGLGFSVKRMKKSNNAAVASTIKDMATSLRERVGATQLLHTVVANFLKKQRDRHLQAAPSISPLSDRLNDAQRRAEQGKGHDQIRPRNHERG